MPSENIPVDAATHAQVTLLARAWEVTPGEAVRRLIEHFQEPATPSTPAATDRSPEHAVAVHAIYDGVRIAGLYDPASQRLTVPNGPGAASYRTPSGAASGVLQALRPRVKPNRNGWTFWTVDESGELLQTLRKH